ncbi:MAG: hypothetical protein ACFCVK_08005 [Acidimicrobiales bacterium]
MTEKIPAKFRKTKTDKWAVMAPVADLERALAEGGKVDVLKKSGDWSTFTVGSLGRPFDVDGVEMCYGYAPGDGDSDGDGDGDRRAPASPGQTASSSGGRGGRSPSGFAPRSQPSVRRSTPEPPPADETEPLPEYRGGPDDEWSSDF